MGRVVKTMSGKPHVPRELIADKDITPKEAMHRKMMRAEKLSKPSCCCGATASNPCVCMKAPEPMQCSATEPKCACYEALEKNAEMDDSIFRDEVTEIAWGDMTDREPFDDEETIDKLYEYAMKAYAFDEGLSNKELSLIWKGAEGHGSISKYINKDYYWVTEQNPHPHEDMIDEGNVTEEMNTAMEEKPLMKAIRTHG